MLSDQIDDRRRRIANGQPTLDFLAIDASVLCSPLIDHEAMLDSVDRLAFVLGAIESMRLVVTFDGRGCHIRLPDAAERVHSDLLGVVPTRRGGQRTALANARYHMRSLARGEEAAVGHAWWVSSGAMTAAQMRSWRKLAEEVHPLIVDLGAPLDWDAVATQVLDVLDPDSAGIDRASSA